MNNNQIQNYLLKGNELAYLKLRNALTEILKKWD